jgi:chorismate synthase
MTLTNADLAAIKGSLLTSKTALQEALDVAGRSNSASLYAVLDWTIASLASQVDYVNEELSKRRPSSSSAERARPPL